MLGARQQVALVALTIPTTANSNDTGGPQALIALTFKTDGTWEFTDDGPSDVLTASPSSGTWLTDASHSADYEIKYTVTAGPSAAGVVTNDASSYTAMSANRAIQLDLTGSGADTDAITVTVDVRKIVNTADAIQDTGIVMSITFT